MELFDGLIAGVLMLGALVVCVPILIVTFGIAYGITLILAAIGVPAEIQGVVILVGGLGGGLALSFVVMLRVSRRLSRAFGLRRSAHPESIPASNGEDDSRGKAGKENGALVNSLPPGSGATPFAEEARRLHKSWSEPRPRPPTSRRRIGWLAVGITVGVLLLLGVWQAADASNIDPSDPGWGDIGFFVSPFFAIAAAVVVGVVLLVVAALRLIDLTPRRAVSAMVIGAVAGPIIYFAVVITVESTVDTAPSSRVLAFMTFVLPVICGLGVTVIAALIGRRPTF